jgi:hypothetical protein
MPRAPVHVSQLVMRHRFRARIAQALRDAHACAPRSATLSGAIVDSTIAAMLQNAARGPRDVELRTLRALLSALYGPRERS